MSIICIDIGNSHISICLYEKNEFILHLQLSTKEAIAHSDYLSSHFKKWLTINILVDFEYIAIASVVPPLDEFCKKLFNSYSAKLFWFISGHSKTNIKFNRVNPEKIGSDLVVGAIAAIDLYPKNNLIIFDLGTASTILAIDEQQQYLGVAIQPGIEIQKNALVNNAAKLNDFIILPSNSLIALSTNEAISSGIIYGQVATLKFYSEQLFIGKPTTCILTGGWGNIIKDYLTDFHYHPNLIFHGLISALKLNTSFCG